MSYPSIFNDVIGPVMRGPSSSHCAASLRIGRICHDLMGGSISEILIEFDPNGSLATTHKEQGSDMGLFGGFLGWEAYDERLVNSEMHIGAAGIQVKIEIKDIQAEHPNTYQITLKNPRETHQVIAISTGGGMIEVIEIDGEKVSVAGDCFLTLIYAADLQKPESYFQQSGLSDEVEIHTAEGSFLAIKSQDFLDETLIEELKSLDGVSQIKQIRPVLPVLTGKNQTVPFITCEEMLAYNQDKNLSLWELAVRYESIRGNITSVEVLAKMEEIRIILKNAVETGLKGTKFEDRILGPQSVKFKSMMEDRKLITGDVLNRIIMYVSAIMEVKSSMGVIVAAPTAGSCGAMPGAVLGVVDSLILSDEEAVKALMIAGLIGVFIAAHSTFAAEVGGCQAECGSGATMAAAAIVHLAGGNLNQSISAASMALQSSLGMICDPIGNRVEAPCLNRNVMAASNALSCANMALADYDHLIPLDEVIETMYEVGKSIPNTLRCTNLGGLSITKTAKEIEARLTQKHFYKSC
ncbi:L-serine ammonia-lyase, iron-sulfur-dependent, subunit alpha [Algoriphagus sp.]|uniref:L-serine ammonia-lyase, iron-sulfur-dependent, subunit alpha n=1 Tax=Algoriphagus sp. TaxID=1872435 RepID=UPI002720BCE5|nr:L-serine ammonia-lyase, iron-sulfur-dependent, subunit alpha [Algoriphagus sp.]MDO8966048.1 L-serine ammonia-lyase, iron-sulfur-dependent, subunit alpha [Algoriphagus sp.]MDP3199275.1 L-serine ammonia-lyase, iron-sulfur-dependent, subunit alpha [Algoriphagus sp.]